MERGKHNNQLQTLSSEQLQTLSALVSRAALAARLGSQSYGGDRDIYQALGYMTNILFEDYFARYCRQDIAKAIIDRPVKATWQGALELIETNDKKETAFEKAWRDLNDRLGIKTRLSRVDRLTGIGRYGILLLGLNDVKKPEDFGNPVGKGAKKELLYIKSFSEQSALISIYERDPNNPRYGMPVIYTISVADESTNNTVTIRVHYTRVIHITDDPLESEVFGTPRLEAVFNRLMDLEKLIGGDAEMFWRGARPGYQGNVDKDYTMTSQTKEDLKDQIDEYEHNLRRIFINEGVDLKALATQVADPANHVDIQIQMISAVTGIPKRILTGSERGELASSQDTGEWLAYVQSRREEHAEPHILRPFVDRLVELGILPTPKKRYSVDWKDLYSVSEKDRVAIGKDRAIALQSYTANPLAESVVPPDLFYELFLGFTGNQIELANTMRADQVNEEQMNITREAQNATGGLNPDGTPKQEGPVDVTGGLPIESLPPAVGQPNGELVPSKTGKKMKPVK